jgi:protoporphyrin/coproporphyrin ferrochelatase
VSSAGPAQSDPTRGYDAIVAVSFGGPEGRADVIPFLENVLRGRNVSRARLEQVAEHYHHFGGVSPINAENRALIAALEAELEANGPHLPVYWGNRNWAPYLTDTVAEMTADGVRRALAFVTSAYSSYSGCRQYLEDIAAARAPLGGRAPVVDKIRGYFDHPGFVQANAERLRVALDEAGPGAEVLFSAHSIPEAMAACCAYQAQVEATAGLVATRAGLSGPWRVAYQSRSGAPGQPWLGPDVAEVVQALPQSTSTVVVAPIGFVSDHMEVVYDLDVELAGLASARGIRLVRAGTAGTHPAFVAGIRQLIAERCDPALPRAGLSSLDPAPDVCPAGHCPRAA